MRPMHQQVDIIRTDFTDTRFRALAKELDEFLLAIDGEELHSRVAPFNEIDGNAIVVVAERDGIPVGCGAARSRDPQTMEIKRMYVRPSARATGLGGAILQELEKWGSETGHVKSVLETVADLESAIRLYARNGYQRCPNYPPYESILESLCFSKMLV